MQFRDLSGAIELVKSKISLLDLVKQHTGEEGKIQGLNISFACPFHAEHDPSFKVNIAGEIHEHFFYCFGCKRGGSIIDFIQLCLH